MKRKDIYITQYDLERLLKVLRELPEKKHVTGFSVQELEDELNRGIVVSPKEVPENVITMNSRVLMRE